MLEILLRDYGIGPFTAVIFNYPAEHPLFTKEASNVPNHGIYETGLRAMQRDV